MSCAAMTWVWGLPVEPEKKLLMLAMSDNTDDEGVCYVLIEWLADRCNIPPRRVAVLLTELMNEGWMVNIQNREMPEEYSSYQMAMRGH